MYHVYQLCLIALLGGHALGFVILAIDVEKLPDVEQNLDPQSGQEKKDIVIVIKTVDSVRAGAFGQLFKTDSFMFGQTGNENNWAKAHYPEGTESIDSIPEDLQKEEGGEIPADPDTQTT